MEATARLSFQLARLPPGVGFGLARMIQLVLGLTQHERAGAARDEHGNVHLLRQRQIAGIGDQRGHWLYILHMGRAAAAPVTPDAFKKALRLICTFF